MNYLKVMPEKGVSSLNNLSNLMQIVKNATSQETAPFQKVSLYF
jgi:hypothetical protein